MIRFEIEDERGCLVPFCLVPEEWIRGTVQENRFRFYVPDDKPVWPWHRREGSTDSEIGVVTARVLSKGDHLHRQSVIVGGAEHLVDHKKVAVFPEGREVFEKRAK